MPADNEVMLNTLRDLDKRKLVTMEELLEVAKLFNVKARLWKAGIPLRKIPRKVFSDIRRVAAENIRHRGGGTVEELCVEIETLIANGACGLGKKTYLPRNASWRSRNPW